MRVTTILNGAILGLSSVVVAATAWTAFEAWGRRVQTRQAQELVELMTSAAVFNERISLERSPYSASLAADKPAGEAVLVEGRKIREKVDEALGQMGALAERIDDAVAQPYREALSDLRRTLASSRAIADKGIGLAKAEREADAAENYVKTLVTLTGVNMKVMLALEADIAHRDAEIGRSVRIVTLAAELRETAGTRSVWLSQYVASRVKFSQDRTDKSLEMNGRIAQLWLNVERSVEQVSATGDLARAFGTAKSRFWVEGGEAYRALLTAAREGTDPGIGIDEWRPRTIGALTTILGLRDAAVALARAEVEVRLEKATILFGASVVLLLLALSFAGGMIVVLRRRVVQPIAGLTHAIGRVADGDYDVRLPSATHDDEVSEIVAAVGVLAAKSSEAERMKARREDDRLAAEAQRREHMNEVADQCNEAIGTALVTIGSALEVLEAAAGSVSDAVESSSHHTSTAVGLSNEASQNVSAVAASAEELAVAVREIGSRVHQSANLARTASADVAATSSKMTRLNDASCQISEILKLISQIAGQTNLLALNATIEAARAGEAGRGFAVVAAEVKSLADQTARATAEIAAQIGDVQNAAADASVAMDSVVATIDQIDQIAAMIAAAIEEQDAATVEIASNISHAATRTARTVDEISGAHEATERSRRVTVDVTEATAALRRQSDVMSGSLARLVAGMKA